MNPKVDEFLSRVTSWQSEYKKMRAITLDCGLMEEFKWKVPCYTYKGKNILIVHGFKDYCAFNFFKGALLSDPEKLLVQQTENVQAGRQIRFKNLQEIIDSEASIKTYIFEAIEVEKAGLKVNKLETKHLDYCEELQCKIDSDDVFKTAFEALTPGRQRGYNLHFSQAKQAKTRITRIENCTSKILQGKGFNDCTCGLSKRMPNCDGSHKTLNK